MKFFSFRWKLLSVIVSVLILALILFSLLINIYEKNLLLKLSSEKGKIVNDTIFNNLEILMDTGSKLQIYDLLEKHFTDEIVSVSIIDLGTGKIVYSSVRENENGMIPGEMLERIREIKVRLPTISITANKSRFFYSYIGKNFFDLEGDFYSEIIYSEKKIYDSIAGQTKQIFLISFVILVIGFLASFFFGMIINKPVETLILGTKEIGNGNLDYNIPLRTSDEFGKLAESFNRMSQNLKFAQKQVIVKELMERDIKLAQDIQNSLFTKELPKSEFLDITTHYEFARVIGGDYYEVLTKDSTTAVLVADVSGKGIPGSLIMVMLRSLIKSLFYQENDLKELMLKVNHLLMRDITPGKFVTLLMAQIAEKTGQVSILNAGHLPLYKYDAAQKKVVEINPGGLGLGLNDGIIFKENMKLAQDELREGDIYLFCTDGVTEAMNPNKEQFGEERLKQAIIDNHDGTSADILEAVKREVRNFLIGEELHDDFTMVVLKKKKGGLNG